MRGSDSVGSAASERGAGIVEGESLGEGGRGMDAGSGAALFFVKVRGVVEDVDRMGGGIDVDCGGDEITSGIGGV